MIRPLNPLVTKDADNVHSCSERRPRWIPMVEVELVEKMTVRANNDLSEVDIMRAIFKDGGIDRKSVV